MVYKPFHSDTYEDIRAHDPIWGVFSLLFGLFAFGMLTATLYEMARKDAPRPLSLQVLRENCRDWTGFCLQAVLAALALYALLILIAGACVPDRLTMRFVDQSAELREDMRRDILSRVAPGKVLRGRVVNRLSDSGPEEGAARSASYTIEFRRLVQYEPVYLRMTVEEKGAPSGDFRILDELFPEAAGTATADWPDSPAPVEAAVSRELDFVANDDLSVSLAPVAGEEQ